MPVRAENLLNTNVYTTDPHPLTLEMGLYRQ